jgi:hypothetical protein
MVKIGNGYVVAYYDRKGCLRLIRAAKGGHKPDGKPGKNETVFRVTDFEEGKSTFKSSASHCGYLSVNNCVYWGTIWDDDDGGVFKKCVFQDWVIECAEVLAGFRQIKQSL